MSSRLPISTAMDAQTSAVKWLRRADPESPEDRSDAGDGSRDQPGTRRQVFGCGACPEDWIGAHLALGVRAGYLPCALAPQPGLLLASGQREESGSLQAGRAFERVWLAAATEIWRRSRWPPRPRWLVKRLATTGPRSGSSGSFNDCSPGAALTTVNPICSFASGTPRHRALPPPASRWTATSTEGNDDVAAGDCGRLWESRTGIARFSFDAQPRPSARRRVNADSQPRRWPFRPAARLRRAAP